MSTTTTTGRGTTTRTAISAGLVLAGGLALAAGPATAHDGDDHEKAASSTHSRAGAGQDLAQLRQDLRIYQDVQAALADGYLPGSGCEESPEGGMGIHYFNPALAAAPIDPARPPILLYQPLPDGGLQLMGAEWLQVDADQDLTTDEDRPSLLGQPFDGPMAGHGPGMPVHYDLHVWLYQANPAGVFAAWNPLVDC